MEQEEGIPDLKDEIEYLLTRKNKKGLIFPQHKYPKWDYKILQSWSNTLKKIEKISEFLLDINECQHMDLETFSLFWKTLSDLPDLPLLIITEFQTMNEWDKSRVEIFLQAMQNMKNLKELYLTLIMEDYEVKEKCISIFTKLLPKMQFLNKLWIQNLSFQEHHKESTKRFIKSLSDIPNLNKLLFIRTAMDSSSINHFIQVIPTIKKLKNLSLRGDLLKSWKPGRIRRFMAAVSRINLESLDFINNEIGWWSSNCISAFNKSLAKLSSLTHLSLNRTSMVQWHKTAISDLANAFIALPVLVTLDLSSNDNGISYFDLDKSLILGQAFTKMKSLSSLKLDYNSFLYAESLHEFVEFIKSLSKIPQLSSLSMNGCGLSLWREKNIMTLINSLLKMTKLAILSIEDNYLGRRDNQPDKVPVMITLAKSLGEMPQLRSLSLAGNYLQNLSNADFNKFVNNLKQSRSITSIHWSNGLPYKKRMKKLTNLANGNQKLMQFTAADCLYQVHTQLKKLSSPLPTEIIQNILSFSGNMKVTKEGFAAIRDKHIHKKIDVVFSPEKTAFSVKKRRV